MNFKLSQNKIILLIIAVSAVLAVWFLIIVPKWRANIINDIENAHSCEIDSDCVADSFDGLTCGGYFNKNELSNISKEAKLYHFLSLDSSGCMGGILLTPKCENKKCIGNIAGD